MVDGSGKTSRRTVAQGRAGTPQGSAALQVTHTKTEETNKNEGGVEEKSEKGGTAERNCYALTPAPCTAHCIANRSEHNQP